MSARDEIDRALSSGLRLRFAESAWKASPRWERVTIIIAFVALYVLADVATHVFQLWPGAASLYPPAGIAFAFFLLYGPRWIGAFLAALLGAALTSRNFPASLVVFAPMAIVKLFFYLGAAEAIRRRGFDPLLRRVRDVVAIVVSAFLVPIPVAIVAHFVVYSTGAERGTAAFHFWLGDFLGILALTPLVVILWGEQELRKSERGSRRAPLRLGAFATGRSTLAVIAIVAVSSLVVFGAWSILGIAALAILLFPLMLSALKWGIRAAAIAVTTLTFVSMGWLFYFRTSPELVLEAQVLVGSLMAAALFAGAATTLKHSALQNLESRERHLRQAEALAGMSSFEWDPLTDTITSWSRINELLGHDPGVEPLTLSVVLDRVDPAERSSVHSALAGASQGMSPVDRSITFITESGRAQYHCRSMIRKTRDAERVLLICRDVTAERELEQEMSLREKWSNRLMKIARVTPWEARKENWEYTFVGASAERLLHYPIESWYRFSFWENHVHPSDRERVAASVRSHQSPDPLSVEYRMLSATGGVVWVRDVIETIPDEHGIVRGFLFDITEAKRAEAELRHVSLHDRLTGLPNRALLHDRLSRALGRLRPGQEMMLLLLDLSRFKLINDSLGGGVGDEVLRQVAQRLRSLADSTDTIGRISGDEFMILREEVESVEDAVVFADRAVTAIAKRFFVQGHDVHVGVNCGIAVARKGDGAEEVMRRADIALYHSKASGKSSVEVFEVSMEDRFLERKALEDVLRTALEQGEVSPYLQPVISLQTGEVISLEALMRWNHPEEGILPPGNLIRVAEETGLITSIDLRIMRDACGMLARFHKAAGRESVGISVNLSGLHFRSWDIVDQIQEILADTGVHPSSLKLELTESVVIGDYEIAHEIMKRIVDIGVEVHLDDFGTGYASLVYLQSFPFSAVKIDRSFVSSMLVDPSSLEVVRSIVALCHTLDLFVIAEGVEEQSHLNELIALGCQAAQGFLFAPALAPDAVETLLSGGRFHPSREKKSGGLPSNSDLGRPSTRS